MLYDLRLSCKLTSMCGGPRLAAIVFDARRLVCSTGCIDDGICTTGQLALQGFSAYRSTFEWSSFSYSDTFATPTSSILVESWWACTRLVPHWLPRYCGHQPHAVGSVSIMSTAAIRKRDKKEKKRVPPPSSTSTFTHPSKIPYRSQATFQTSQKVYTGNPFSVRLFAQRICPRITVCRDRIGEEWPLVYDLALKAEASP